MGDFLSRQLLEKLKDGTITEEERLILENWYISFSREGASDEVKEELERFLQKTIFPPFADEQSVLHAKRISIKFVLIYAAAFLSICFGIWSFYFSKSIDFYHSTASNDNSVIHPASHRALLKLDDGKEILLDNLKVGDSIIANGGSITKSGDGKIAYNELLEISRKSQTSLVGYNLLSTPKAGHYQITLSDGTNVWLNAESSIKFPSTFIGAERMIEISGEAFIEVKKAFQNGRYIPFKVKTGAQIVEVLGTTFNIKGYKDEGVIVTTLLEGSVNLSIEDSDSKKVLLKPKEQAVLQQSINNGETFVSNNFTINEVDPVIVTAWKEGFFRFNGISLPELMREVSRWYDMEVEYLSPVKDYEFIGEISRDTELSNVLVILEAGGVNFRVEGKKIIVL